MQKIWKKLKKGLNSCAVVYDSFDIYIITCWLLISVYDHHYHRCQHYVFTINIHSNHFIIIIITTITLSTSLSTYITIYKYYYSNLSAQNITSSCISSSSLSSLINIHNNYYSNLSTQYIKRLKLTKASINTLCDGITAIANQTTDCIGKVRRVINIYSLFLHITNNMLLIISTIYHYYSSYIIVLWLYSCNRYIMDSWSLEQK